MTTINRIDPMPSTDPFRTPRAATFLNFAAHLRIDPTRAIDIAFDAIDDDSNALDISTTPDPFDMTDRRRALLLALANESFRSDDDFDDFIHELHHSINNCPDPDYCSDDE